MRHRTIIAAIAAAVVIPLSNAAAEDYLASIGGPVAVSGHAPTLNAGDGFLLDTIGGRSYSCEGTPSNAASEFAFGTSIVGTLAGDPDTLSGRPTGQMSPIVTGGIGTAGRTRVSFTPTQADRYRISVADAKGGGEEVRVWCTETTIFGGFNTSAADFNFLELRNVSTAPISGFITAVDYAGNQKIVNKPFTIPPLRRVDFDLHSEVGSGTYGILKVTHDGPHRTLRGRVSYYELTPWNSLIRRGGVALQPALN
ncbi:MAG: hypothetical protein KDD66_05410 [Bdellovibrionales bacterium]|nr:hypothetical protein [Bdellovibrionales bacterium]